MNRRSPARSKPDAHPGRPRTGPRWRGAAGAGQGGRVRGQGTLRVTRPAGLHRDARRSYRVLVDGEERGTIAPGGVLEVPLPAGRHVVRAAIDWTGSPELGVDVAPRRRVDLRVEPAGPPLTALLQLVGRHRYLRLVPAAG